MNSNNLQHILLNLRSISSEQKLQLDALVNEYPFFTLGKVLQLKYLHDQEPENFSDQLKVVAVQVSDRTRLKELMENRISEIKYLHTLPYETSQISDPIDSVEEENQESALIGETSSDKKEKNTSFSVDDVLAASNPVVIETENAASDLNTLVNQADFTADELNPENDFDAVTYPESSVLEVLENSSEVVNNEMNTNINDAKQMDENAALTAIERKWKNLLDNSKAENDLADLQAKAEEESEDTAIKIEDPTLEETPEQVEQRKSRLAWFSSYAHKMPAKRIPKMEEIVRVSDNYLGAESIEIQDFVADFKLPEEKVSTKPRPTKTIQELEKEPLVTETLANLYAEYGRREDAIEIYEKLGLLYPEKLSYFANLIEKLK